MSVASSVGVPQYSADTIKYIPNLFAPKTLVKFYSKSVFPAITNTDYEGQISDVGDEVTVRQRPDITVSDYQKGGTLNPEHPQAPPIKFTIDQAISYDFIVDAIDEKQADIVLSDEFTDDAGNKMREAIDSRGLAQVYVDSHAKNKGATAGYVSGLYNLGASGSPLELDQTNMVLFLTSLGAVLDEQDVPDENRFVVLPVWMRFLLLNSEIKQAYMTGDTTSPIRNGLVGEIDRFKIYVSNKLSMVTDGGTGKPCHNVIAGHTKAITFAAQLVKNESLPANRTFGREYRGLHVFGYKVMKKEALAHAYVTRKVS